MCGVCVVSVCVVYVVCVCMWCVCGVCECVFGVCLVCVRVSCVYGVCLDVFLDVCLNVCSVVCLGYVWQCFGCDWCVGGGVWRWARSLLALCLGCVCAVFGACECACLSGYCCGIYDVMFMCVCGVSVMC